MWGHTGSLKQEWAPGEPVKDSGLAGPQVYPQVYAVPSLLRNASDLVHPRRSYCRAAKRGSVLSTSEFPLCTHLDPPLRSLGPHSPTERCDLGLRRPSRWEVPWSACRPLAPLWPERRGPRRLGPSSSLSAPAVSDATSPKAHRPRLLLLGDQRLPLPCVPLISRPLKGGAPCGPALGPPSCRNLPGTPVVMPSVSLGTPGLPVPRPSPACHRAFPFTEHLRGPFDPMPHPRAEQHHHHLILQLRKLRHRGKAS